MALKRRLLERCWALFNGTAHGHRRPDIPTRYPALVLNTNPYPFLILYENGGTLVYSVVYDGMGFSQQG